MSNLRRSIVLKKIPHLNFWSGFNEFIKDTPFIEHFPVRTLHQPINYYNIPLKSSNPYISLAFGNNLPHIRVSIYMKDISYWDDFYEKRSEIEEILGELEWNNAPEVKRCFITKRFYLDINDPSKWNECYQWYIDNAIEFKRVFSRYC